LVSKLLRVMDELEAVEKWRATLTGRPFPNVYRRQRKADGFLGTGWNPVGEMLGFHGVLFQTP
jgi:hypothetical protein